MKEMPAGINPITFSLRGKHIPSLCRKLLRGHMAAPRGSRPRLHSRFASKIWCKAVTLRITPMSPASLDCAVSA